MINLDLNCMSAWAVRLFAMFLIATAGCTTVETSKPTMNQTDRSGAGIMEAGDPAAPADRAVVSAADDRGRDAADDNSAATRARNTSAAAKPPSDSQRPAGSVSETREQRLHEVAADFDRRRDEAQYQAALNRWREDDAAGCREVIGQLLARTANHCPARLLLADVELSEGNPKAALEQARQVLALEPKNAEAHHVMGLSLDALGETAAAIAQYEQATRLDTRNEQYAACYHAAVDASIPPSATPPNETRTGNARPGEVRPSPTRLSTIPRDDIRPEDVASANSANSPVYAECSDKPDRAGATAGAGRVVAASAEQPTHSGSDESADAQLAVRRAAEALRNNRPQQAIDIAIAALRRDPKSAALYRIKGAAHYRLGNYAAAQVAITQALSLDNTDALAYFLMGSTLQRLGQAEAAKRQFAEAARLDPRFAQTRD